MPAEGDYSRLYHAVVDDTRFDGIYDDDAHWACYTRLLMLAEAAWPASAPIPRAARQESVDALAKAGIIELQAGDRFRIHGLDPERAKRSEHGRQAAEARWNRSQPPAPTEPPEPYQEPCPEDAPSNARASCPSMLDETRLDETRRDEQSARAPVVPMPVIHAVEERSRRPWVFRPGTTFYDTLAANVRDFGDDRVVAAMDGWLAEAAVPHPNAQQLVAGSDRQLHPLSTRADAVTRALADVERRKAETARDYLEPAHPPPILLAVGGGEHPLPPQRRPSGDSRQDRIRVSRSPGEGEHQ